MAPKKQKPTQQKSEEGKKEMAKFTEQLAKDSDSDGDAVVIDKEEANPTSQTNPANLATNINPPRSDPDFPTADTNLSEAEKEVLREELLKTEDEIATLKQVLFARQKHAAELKRKLGLTPLSELTADINKGLKVVTDSEAYHKTSEVAAAATDTVKEKWTGLRNSNLFKSFESKLGSAYNNAKMAASTSIDHLAGAARGPSAATTPSEEHRSPPS